MHWQLACVRHCVCCVPVNAARPRNSRQLVGSLFIFCLCLMLTACCPRLVSCFVVTSTHAHVGALGFLVATKLVRWGPFYHPMHAGCSAQNTVYFIYPLCRRTLVAWASLLLPACSALPQPQGCPEPTVSPCCEQCCRKHTVLRRQDKNMLSAQDTKS